MLLETFATKGGGGDAKWLILTFQIPGSYHVQPGVELVLFMMSLRQVLFSGVVAIAMFRCREGLSVLFRQDLMDALTFWKPEGAFNEDVFRAFLDAQSRYRA